MFGRKGQIALLLAALACIGCLFVGCGKGGDISSDSETGASSAAPAKTLSLTAEEAAQKLADTGVWAEELVALKESRISVVYEIEDTDFVSAAAFCSPSGAYADSVAVFVTKDAAAAGAVEKALRAYQTEQIGYWKDYRADQVKKLENAFVYKFENAVVFCTCEDTAALQALVENGFVS